MLVANGITLTPGLWYWFEVNARTVNVRPALLLGARAGRSGRIWCEVTFLGSAIRQEVAGHFLNSQATDADAVRFNSLSKVRYADPHHSTD